MQNHQGGDVPAAPLHNGELVGVRLGHPQVLALSFPVTFQVVGIYLVYIVFVKAGELKSS
jgi:hypothetical protein